MSLRIVAADGCDPATPVVTDCWVGVLPAPHDFARANLFGHVAWTNVSELDVQLMGLTRISFAVYFGLG